MSILIPETDLPQQLTVEQAVESAYASDLSEVAANLAKGLPALIECEKDLAPFLFVNLRARLKGLNLKSLYLDGRPRDAGEQGAASGGFIATLLAQLRDAVRGPVERRVVVLPHLDVLTTGEGGLTSEAREVIPLLYENPELVWLGFKNPSFRLPRVIENLFPRQYSLLGVARPRLRFVVTQKEARKFGREFNPWDLYKHVSGMNAARLRKLLAGLEGEDYPIDPKRAYQQIRQATMSSHLEVPDVDLQRDIGGYARVKQRLQTEILDVLSCKDRILDAAEIQRVEELIPRGMIFWGPPGTGKTLFAKALATALGAAITIVSGPELKSRWVGESEENLRQIFHRARRSAPAIIVFDELDSFASARGTYKGSGVEHSMVNQLLTEMDGFHREELVFVVGTTNFVEILDPALLRPGRFEFLLHIPYPQAEDRRAILRIYDASMQLQLTPDALEFAVRRTGESIEGTATNYSGDHLNALCRAVARVRLREKKQEPTQPEDIERALTEWIELPIMTEAEELVAATHETGHAVCSIFCEHSTPIERIAIRGDAVAAFEFALCQTHAQRYSVTRGKLLDNLCVLMGGREAEELLLGDFSIGASSDLRRATQIARAIAVDFDLGGEEEEQSRFGLGSLELGHDSPVQSDFQNRRAAQLLLEARSRAATILRTNHLLLESLRDALLRNKALDAASFQSDHAPIQGN